MKNQSLEKYRKFIGDNDFVDEFLGTQPLGRRRPNDRHARLKETESTEPIDVFIFQRSPAYVHCTMRDYQVEGLNWLINMHENGINSILADEMGLGKTLQTIALLGYLKYTKKENHVHLVIVPKSTLQNWKNEFKKFLPDFKIKIFHCSRVDTKKEGAFLARKNYDACITTYEMVLSAQKILKKAAFSYVVIDEAHRIKNECSILSLIVRMLDCKHRLLLTGTPLQNNIKELWALLNFIVPEIFNDSEKFEAFVTRNEDEQSTEKLRKVLQLFFLRREKADVEKSLLPKKILNLYANLSVMQRNWYKSVLTKDLGPLLGINASRSILNNVVVQLRKCCNHPYLFPDAEPGPPYTTEEHIVTNSGKMIVLDKLLKKLKSEGSRVLIFSQMSRMVDILEDYCIFRGYEYCRLDGTTQSEDRTEAIEEFNKEDSTKFLFLLTTRAGGLGINLATADSVILYDADWNPQADLQAQDRAHRIGQKKQVVVYRLLTANTIEERIIERSLQKLKLDEILIQKKEKPANLNQEELYEILATGVDKFDTAAEIGEVDEILRIGEEKTRQLEKTLESTTLAETSGKQINAYEFEGENYNIKKLREFVPVEKDIRRRRGSNLFTSRKMELINYPVYQFYPLALEEMQKKEIKLYDNGQQLSEEDQIKKAEMLSEGFDTWTRKDYNNFVKAISVCCRDEYAKIAELVERSEDDIKKYSEVFWKRITEIPDHEKIIAQSEKTEGKRKRLQTLKSILWTNENLEISPNFTIAYASNLRSKLYTEELDLDLLKYYIKYSNVADPIYNMFLEIRRSKKYMFNYFIKSRNVSDLNRRLDKIINLLLKQYSN